ncbi:hypothetical protein FNV43_RR05480 [Rhamnella rubrinervis]|uniref:MLO-like protein n=1 Tax=Rhamnella rubrinervis TaxID=2594499 RepID=A0A8K0MQP6_9ROSA|nr:hypothetical protein FNV43_RR05480 [Rhamnella rubrinervis]
MAGGSGGGQSRSLQDTPTWALATVCFVFIALSIFIEHLIHLLCNWLKKHRKVALFEAVEKLKSVLMLLGFMSLTLTVTQRPISSICVSNKVAYTFLPCRKSSSIKTAKAIGFSHLWAATPQNSFSMKDLFEGIHLERERKLAENGSGSSSDYCESQGKTSFISQDGINQLNNFIFVLAIMQIVYSVLTMALGRAKMRRWESWEMETRTVEYQVANDPNRFRLTRETTFGRRHMNSCVKASTLLWIKCFFRQFFHSVAKVDYLTLRHGFISNAFEVAFFIWVTAQFGFKSCYHERRGVIIIRVVLTGTVQVMCSYITLPLYALVTQMGSSFKSAVLEEQTMNRIKQWHSEVKDKRKKQAFLQFSVDDPSSTTMHTTTSTSTGSSDPSYHRKRAVTFGEITQFLSEPEINVLNHQRIEQIQLEQVAGSCALEDIEIAEVGQHPIA